MSSIFRSITDYMRLQYRFHRFGTARVRAMQRRSFRRMLSFARAHSPFYREMYQGLRSEEVIDAIPLLSAGGEDRGGSVPGIPLPSTIIDKTTMMHHFDRLNTCGLRLDEVMPWAVDRERAKEYLGYYQDRFVVGLSSGTSGNKGIYVTARALTERLPAVMLARGGIPIRLLPVRILFLLRVFSQGFADIRAPLISLRYLSTMTSPQTIIDQALADRTNILMAPPSLLRVLLPLAPALRGRLRRILCYAEVLEDEEKTRLEQAFGSPVAQIYQASEGQIASPCSHGTLHINEDLALIELYDEEGRPVTGEGSIASTLLITNLINTAQPLIRYRMNDLVELGGPCPCGSSFRTIRRVLGRNDDVLHLRCGDTTRAVFPDLVSRWIITADDAIREFRVVVFHPDAMEVVLDILPSVDEQGRRRICEELRQRLVSELASYGVMVADISIRCAAIPLPASLSKYKRFVNLTLSQ